jgi:hypothetical protein
MSLNCGLRRAYCSSPRLYVSMENPGGMILAGQDRRSRRKTCPSITLSTTNPAWTDSGANYSLRDERLATNCMRHGTAHRSTKDLLLTATATTTTTTNNNNSTTIIIVITTMHHLKLLISCSYTLHFIYIYLF